MRPRGTDACVSILYDVCIKLHNRVLCSDCNAQVTVKQTPVVSEAVRAAPLPLRMMSKHLIRRQRLARQDLH